MPTQGTKTLRIAWRHRVSSLGGEGETIQGSGLAWKIFPNCIAGHSSDEKIAPVPGMMRISHMPIA
ncbi:hypothetical protein [Burkholderia ubonensis]|uniref:hypothetical protein n=1 Tax=Burkholderia ubonensis TaxID=101571 RepID=UPI000B1795F1|nr:hypothetical protein [Burkholderia ubonensis]